MKCVEGNRGNKFKNVEWLGRKVETMARKKESRIVINVENSRNRMKSKTVKDKDKKNRI